MAPITICQMRRAFSAFLSLALAASAAPTGAYAQAAVRIAAPKAFTPLPVAPIAALNPAPSFIKPGAHPHALPLAGEGLKAHLPSPLVRTAAVPAASVAHAQAALAAVPATASAIAGLQPDQGGPRPDSPPLFNAANDNSPKADSGRLLGSEARGRISLRFLELRAAFGARKAEDVPPAAAPQALPRPGLDRNLSDPAARPDGAPTVPAAPEPKKPGRGLFGIAPVLVFFLAALAIENVGIEAQNLGFPPLITKVFGDVTLSAEMGMWAAFADIVGSIITPPIIKKLGLKKAFLWSGGVRLVFAALTAGLLATGHITVPVLMALTALGAFAGGVNYTAEKAIPAVILQQDRAGLERFKAARQGVIEVIATFIPIAAGAIVANFGFLPAVFAFPVAGAVAMALVAMTLRMPQRAAAALSLRLPEGGAVPTGAKDFLRSLTRGTRLLWGQTALRASFLGYAAFGLLTHLLYWIIAPAYGVLIAGPGHEEAAALVQGWMLGLFSLGGLAASIYMMREHRRFDRMDPAKREGAMRSSLRTWMVLGTVTLAAMATMAFPLPAWGALTVPALALIPFGMAQVVAKLKLEALFQSAAPTQAIDDVTAAMEAWMSVAIMAGLWGVKWAFAASTGYGPFAILSWAMLPLAAACVYLTALLARKPKSA